VARPFFVSPPPCFQAPSPRAKCVMVIVHVLHMRLDIPHAQSAWLRLARAHGPASTPAERLPFPCLSFYNRSRMYGTLGFDWHQRLPWPSPRYSHGQALVPKAPRSQDPRPKTPEPERLRSAQKKQVEGRIPRTGPIRCQFPEEASTYQRSP
jgi:hypothetical protein